MKLASWVAPAFIALLFATSASAADLGARTYTKAPPIEPVYNWTGFYIGANAGYGWGKTDTNEYCLDCTGVIFPLGEHKSSGFIGGGQIGYNYQLDHVVLGIEGDFDGANVHGASADLFEEYTNATRYNWVASIRGRAGFSFDRIFVYGTGGAAFTSVHNSSLDNEGANGTNTKTGWVAGGGLEYALDNHWSVRGEYLYYDFGTEILRGDFVPVRPIYFHYSDRLSSARAGVNYKF